MMLMKLQHCTTGVRNSALGHCQLSINVQPVTDMLIVFFVQRLKVYRALRLSADYLFFLLPRFNLGGNQSDLFHA